MLVRGETFDPNLSAAALLAQPAPEGEGEADNAVIAMNARASAKFPLRQVSAMVASAFEQQDVVVLQILQASGRRGYSEWLR